MTKIKSTLILILFCKVAISQINLVDKTVKCNYEFDWKQELYIPKLVDSYFESDTLVLKISCLQNCGYESGFHDYSLQNDTLFISSLLEKTETDSLGNEFYYMVSEEDCECLFDYSYSFIGLDGNKNYEIVFNDSLIGNFEK